MAEHIGWKPALSAALGKIGETLAVRQVALTSNLIYTIPEGTPSGIVHRVAFTQDGTGGHTVTYDDQPVSVDLTAGASTTVELHPVGTGYVVRYPVVDLDAQVSALAEDGGSALSASLSSTYAPLSPGVLTYLDLNQRAPHPAAPLTTPTYDGSGQAVHPDVLVLDEPWGGYRYWMAMTPYPNGVDTWENPSILASHDGQAWEVPGGLVNPIDAPSSGFYADPCLVLDGSLLRCIYSGIFAKSSSDGVTWSARQSLAFASSPAGDRLSPSVVKHGAAYHYWCVSSTPSPNTLLHAAGTTALTYGDLTACTVNGGPAGRDLWHVAVRRTGCGYVGAFTYCDLGTSGSTARLHLATSPDGVTWTVGVAPLLSLGTWWDNGSIYRACIVPTDGIGGIWGRLWYSALSQTGSWRIGYTELRNPGPEMLVAAKGDMLIGSAADTLRRVAVGANGTIWTADSTQDAGGKWSNTAALVAPSFSAATPAATFGPDLAPVGGLGNWTPAGGATWANPNLTIPSGGSVSCTVEGIVAGRTYQIDVTRSASSGGKMVVALGAASISLESNYNNRVTLVATATGNLTLTVGGGTWVATVQTITCREVTAKPSRSATVGNIATRSAGNNHAVGYDAHSTLTTGSACTAVGYEAQKSLTTGIGDTAIGFGAQKTMTTASSNTAIGYEAQKEMTVGSSNTAIGSNAQVAATSADSNTAVGALAQLSLTSGPGNTAVGHSAQQALTSGSYNTAVGYLSSTGAANGSAVAVGFNAAAEGSGAVALGSGSNASHAGAVAIGKNSTTSAPDQVVVGPRDVEVQSASKGLVLKSPDGSRWRITITDAGVLTPTKL